MILDRQGNIDPVPCPLEPLRRGPGGLKRWYAEMKICMQMQNEAVGAMLHHVYIHALCEGLGGWWAGSIAWYFSATYQPGGECWCWPIPVGAPWLIVRGGNGRWHQSWWSQPLGWRSGQWRKMWLWSCHFGWCMSSFWCILMKGGCFWGSCFD